MKRQKFFFLFLLLLFLLAAVSACGAQEGNAYESAREAFLAADYLESGIDSSTEISLNDQQGQSTMSGMLIREKAADGGLHMEMTQDVDYYGSIVTNHIYYRDGRIYYQGNQGISYYKEKALEDIFDEFDIYVEALPAGGVAACKTEKGDDGTVSYTFKLKDKSAAELLAAQELMEQITAGYGEEAELSFSFSDASISASLDQAGQLTDCRVDFICHTDMLPLEQEAAGEGSTDGGTAADSEIDAEAEESAEAESGAKNETDKGKGADAGKKAKSYRMDVHLSYGLSGIAYSGPAIVFPDELQRYPRLAGEE